MRAVLTLALTLTCLAGLTCLTASPARAVTCQNVTFDGASFTACEVSADEDLRLFLLDPEGTPLGSFAAVAAQVEGGLSFAMNAGMFHDDFRPVGLFIQDGRQLTPASDGGGYGNFGLLPNGIFCISDRLQVWESDAYAKAAPDCTYATQSGPMLVIGGALHPRFLPDSTSFKLRNGVGTSADGTRAVFAISNEPVRFHHFARLFRDHFGLPDALFLDGSVSRLHAPALGRSDLGFPMGPILGVVDAGG